MGRRRSGSGAGFRTVLFTLFLFALSQAASICATNHAFAQSADEIARRNIASFKSTFDPEMVKAAGLTQSQAEQMRKVYAFQISNDYTARRLLKTVEFEGLGREYYKMWFQEGDGLIRQVIVKAKGKMSGYSPEVLDLIEVIQNDLSRTEMKAPMDFDVGILTRTKEQAREVLEKIGGPGGVVKFHRDLQKALEEAYLEVFAGLGGTPGSINAARSFISATTGWHPEAYADVKVLKKGGVASKDLVQQTVDVSKYKVSEMRKHAEHGALTLDEAMEEAARGTAKDLDKVERVFNHIEKITGVQPKKWSDEQRKMIEVMKKVEKMEMSAAEANAEIGRISGGRLDLFSACDNLMDQMESAWKLRPRKPQELLLSIFAEFLDDADYDKSFKALLEGNTENLPASAKKVIGELEVLGKSRLLSIRGGAASQFMVEFAKDFPAYRICAKPGDESVQELLKLIESGSKGEDVAVIFGKEQTEQLRKIQELMKPEIKAKIQVRFSTNKFALWELDQKGRVLLGDPGAATLGIDAGVGLAMAFWQTSTIMDQNLSPEEESRQILNAWGTSLPVVGDIAQGMIEGIEAYYGDDKTKYFKAGAWLAIGAAGLVPGAQAPAMVLGLTLATYEVSSSYFDIKKDKELLEAWLASGEFDKESGKLQKLYDNKAGVHELSFEGIITGGGIPYKEVLTETTIRESVYLYTERNGLDQNEKLQSYIRALKKLYDFPFKETLREPLTIGKPLFAATIREGGAKEPFKTVAMLMFVKAKQIADAEANRACQGIMAQVEAEYQARHRTGDADRIFDELKALGGRLGLPLYENVNKIFDSFSNFIIEGLKTPWVRESISRRRVLLAEKYLNGYLEIEKSLKTIRGVFERAGVNPPGFNLSGYLEVDAPRMKDLEAAYVNRAIGDTARDVQAIHRELSGDNAYIFNSNRPDPCDAELFKQLANIRVRIVEAEDRKLLLEQWTGKKSAAERSRDASLRKAQDATQGMKTGSVVTIPSAVWDSLCENYEAAYAWGNVRLEGSQVYEEAIVGQTERIEKLTKEYADAKAKGKEPMGTCLAGALQGSIQVSNAAPAEGDPASARIVLTKGQAPKGAQWTWQATGGIEIGNAAGEQASLTARSSGTVTATLVMAGKTLATLQKTVTVKSKDKKDGKTDGKTDDKTTDKKETAVTAATCSYEYTDWGECSRATKKQARTVKATKPEGCVEKGKPSLEQGCTPPPSEEDKKNAYFNCLCRCSSGWAGHIGVWYDPEGKSEPECKSSGPCFGGAGAFGCTRRHFFVGPNDCGKGCWEAAFGKDTYDPKKADEGRKSENKKYKKPLTVKITPSKNPADFGDIIDLQAEAGEGSGGYSYHWGGCAQDAKDYLAKVANTRDCKPCAATVTVTDQDGDSTSATVTIQCNTVKVKLTKENPKENTVPVGGKASFYAEVFSGDKPFSGPTLFYVWERNPDAIFGDPKNPQYETSGGSQMRSTATFRKAGTTPVWVTVLREIDGKKTTIGESEQIPITVANPELSIKVTPEKPNIGQEVKLQVESKPALGDDIVGFWWEIPGYWTGTGDKASFKPKDDKPVKVTVHAKTKDGGDEVGTKDVTITAQAYQVSIGEPRYLESPPQIWKCDTQLGQAQHCGMVTLKPNEFAVSRDIFLKATLSPQPESPRYRWTVDPSGSCGSPGAGSEIKLNCSNTGTYTVKVEVTNADGAKLGEASQSVSVSVSQSDLNNSKNAKDASEKLQKAKGLVAEGKLDEAIVLTNEAVSLDPKNAEAKSLSQKWNGEKQTVTQQLDKTKKAIAQNQFDLAHKEFAAAQKLHPKYPPVVETEKLLKAKQDGYKKDVGDKLAKANGLVKQGKLDEAIKEAQDAAKADPQNKEAASTAAKFTKEKETIHQQIDKAKKLMDENKFADAQKELVVASNLNGYYAPVPAANKELGDRWGKYNSEVRDKVYEVRSANEKKDFGKALETAAAWRASTKLDPYADGQLKQQEDWAKQWKAQKEKQIETLKAAGEKAKAYDYAGALKQYDEGFANGQNIYNGSEPEYKEAVELRGQTFTKNKRLNELIPWVQKAAESKESMPAATFENGIKSADEAIALQPNNEQLKKWREMIVSRAEKTKADGDRTAQGRKYLDAAGNAERSYLNSESSIQARQIQWGEQVELQQQLYLTTAIENFTESLKYIPDAAVEKKIKDLQATREGRKKSLEQYRTSRTLLAEADALYRQATQDPDIQSASPKYDEAAQKFRKSLSLYRPFNAENIEKTIFVLETYKHERWVKKYWADGQALEKEGKRVEALAAYDKAIASLHPTTDQKSRLWYETQAQELRNRINGAKTWRADGEAKQKAGKTAEAIASYKQSLALLPDAALAEHVRILEGKQAEAGEKKASADKLWQEGTALFNQGRPSEALTKFKESLGYWSDASRTKYVSDLEARRAKATALRDEGAKLQQGNRVPEAIAKYKESLSYWPDTGLTSHIAALEGKVKQDADTAARKARAKQLRDEGYALQQKNQLQAAVGKYRESLAILPDKQLEDYIRQLETKTAAKPVAVPQTTSTPAVTSTTTPAWTGTWRSENRPEDPADFALNQSGSRVTGTYSVNATVKMGTGPAQTWSFKGRVEGTVSGNTLHGTYTDSDDTKTTGRIELVMNPDGNSCRVNIRNSAANENWTARRVSSIGGSSGIGSSATQAAAITSVAVQYVNGSQKNCHIFPDGDSFGPGNRLTPGEMRSVTVKTRSDGGVTFKAGRDGSVMATKTWGGGVRGGKLMVVFDDRNQLTVSPAP